MKKLTSLILSLIMVFSFGVSAFASTPYNEDVFKAVFDATKLIGDDVSYSSNEKISNLQVAAAAINLYMNEKETAFEGLNTEYLFANEYARAFYAFARDIINKTILLTIDAPYMSVSGVQKEIDPGIGTTPIIRNDRTLLPVRAVVEEMGGEVFWNEATREVTLKLGNNTIVLTIDSPTAYLNGEAKTLDCSPIILNSRTLLPIRFIAESFGYNVGWEPTHRVVSIQNSETLDLTKENAENLLSFGKKNATVAITIDALTFYLAKRYNDTVTYNKADLLQGIDRSKEIDHKLFSQLLCELDDIAPLLVKIEITKDGKTTDVPAKLEKNLSKYPSNSSEYRAIFEGIPSDVYTMNYAVSANQKPIDSYNFTRDFRYIFLDMLSPWVVAAYNKSGVDMKMSYYPALCVEDGNGYTMRVKIDVISCDGNVLLGDVFKTADGSNPNIKLKAGTSFWCDLKNNRIIDNVEMPSDTLTIAGYYPY